MSTLPTIQTERLTLAALDPSYAELVADYFVRNRTFLAPWNPVLEDAYYTAAWQAKRLESDLAELQAGRSVRLWMFLREDAALARVVGSIALSNIVRGAFHGCHLGYMIDEHVGGGGLMTEGVRAVCQYGLGELGLHRIEANIMPHNTRSMRVAEKAGFVQEGLAVRYLRINGKWSDHYRYALIGSDD